MIVLGCADAGMAGEMKVAADKIFRVVVAPLHVALNACFLWPTVELGRHMEMEFGLKLGRDLAQELRFAQHHQSQW